MEFHEYWKSSNVMMPKFESLTIVIPKRDSQIWDCLRPRAVVFLCSRIALIQQLGA